MGAAGMGILVALHNAIAKNTGQVKQACQQLLANSLWIDAGDAPGGILGSYRINANTHATDAVAAIADNTPLARLRDEYLKIPEVANVLIALPRLDEILIKPMAAEIASLLGDNLLCNRRVSRISDQQGRFSSYDDSGQLIACSENLILCSGGKEKIIDELVPWRDKVEFGGDFMRRINLAGLPESNKPVVITSASHSGFSCAWRLLNDPLFVEFAKDRDIVILQRRHQIKLRCRREMAIEYGLNWDEERDVCSKTGRIFANGGLRKDAKYLYLDIRDGKEKRVRLEKIEQIGDVSSLLDGASLIIQCAGFVADPPEIEIDGRKREIESFSDNGLVVDAQSGQTIPGLFACGLGMHNLPDNFHGEKSFNGSINGLQSYPLIIAPGIIQQLISTRQESV